MNFPPVETADEHGLLGIGGDASVDNLIAAYSQGIFPWPWSDEYIAWFCPPTRAILEFKNLHISHSLKKFLKKHPFRLAISENFTEVMKQCGVSKNRKNQFGTWITPAIMDGYQELQHQELAVSFEAYHDDRLVGGLYGVRLGNYFSGESMFYAEENASKVAFVFAVEQLRQAGVTWMDCQVLTDTTKSFGATEIPRAEFLKLLRKTI